MLGIRAAKQLSIASDLRGFVFGPPFHIVVKVLHLYEPIAENDSGVVLVMIRCYPVNKTDDKDDKRYESTPLEAKN